eukprot:gene7627-576_t
MCDTNQIYKQLTNGNATNNLHSNSFCIPSVHSYTTAGMSQQPQKEDTHCEGAYQPSSIQPNAISGFKLSSFKDIDFSLSVLLHFRGVLRKGFDDVTVLFIPQTRVDCPYSSGLHTDWLCDKSSPLVIISLYVPEEFT